MNKEHSIFPLQKVFRLAICRFLLVVATVALLGLWVDGPDIAQASGPGLIHYPDLWPYYAYGLRADYVYNGTRRKILSFHTAIANYGQGPLELFPQNNSTTGNTDAYQRLFTHDASGNWYAVGANYVGTFAFHSGHNHWHFENFAAYELRNVASDGSVGANVLASSPKVSFCLLDSWQGDPSLEHTSDQTYLTCSQNGVQGISVGWADIYSRDLPGQNLDITGLPDGYYWLLIWSDPSNVISEGVESNNVNGTKFRLRDRRIYIVQYGQ